MRKELLELLKKDSYRKGQFTLSSGKISEYYINCKPVTLDGIGLRFASNLMLDYVETKVVAGLTLGADPLVSGVSLLGELSGLIIRKKPKGHGTASQVEGPLPPIGTNITVLEDVVSTGGSAIKAVNVLRDLEYTVDRVVTIVDRQEGGKDAMMEAGVELYSLFKLSELTE